MTDDLIARLKAAHAAATPGPWEIKWPDYQSSLVSIKTPAETYPLVYNSIAPFALGKDANLIVLTRNYLPVIIAALEERERMRAVVEAARSEAQAREAMLSVVPIGAYTRNDAALMTAWIDAGSVLDAALDAMEGKG